MTGRVGDLDRLVDKPWILAGGGQHVLERRAPNAPDVMRQLRPVA